ncbi:dihydrolipoamide acetyltransferase family protein [Lysinibacillus endophyticus]|uniref:dihydrolipoamide acetyltransferase family protein n=1 Tax=Ureibacillus endophyticus TaxID=1978490 RepID=UPI00209F1645|nr:dihydrolipoamide acetyltransferase family protein [Lysinibacillus endophyticus]MCP1146742.1 2-oxo acid dehydrogenase subunit E2 [Lysinibacillus endophyticus]
MATEVLMPKLGATMEEGTIVSWIANEGDLIEEGDPIAEIQTDKIVLEVEAETTGYLLKTLFEPGTTVNVHEVIAYIGDADEPIETSATLVSETSAPPVVLEDGVKPRKTPAANKLARENNIPLSSINGTGPNNRIQLKDVEDYLKQQSSSITPLAKKMAVDLQVSPNEITGTGHNGKITKQDVLASTKAPTIVKEEAKPNVTKTPLKGMRKVIAERMAESYYTAPHVTLSVEINMSECVALRKQLIPIIEKETGHRLSYNDLMIKAVAHTLSKNKSLNISLQKDEIYQYEDVNVGFAVALDEGLVVPVIKNADKIGLSGIVNSSKQLVSNIKNGKLHPEYFEQGTFTISNLGMYAVDTFNPIINQPQSAILGVGRIVEKPVVKNGEIAIDPTMQLSLSFDHRIIDGAPAAQFLTDLKDYLENPMKMLV